MYRRGLVANFDSGSIKRVMFFGKCKCSRNVKFVLFWESQASTRWATVRAAFSSSKHVWQANRPWTGWTLLRSAVASTRGSLRLHLQCSVEVSDCSTTRNESKSYSFETGPSTGSVGDRQSKPKINIYGSWYMKDMKWYTPHHSIGCLGCTW
jgi:hypothetical protein